MDRIENADVTKTLVRSIIQVFSRRTSDAYAVVMTGNVVKKLMEKYNFLKYVEINMTQYSEEDTILIVKPSINTIGSQEIGKALQDLVGTIVLTMGKDAGYFFIKELKDSMDAQSELILRNMGVDLDFMHFQYVVEKKQTETIDHAAIMKKVLRVLMDIMERDVTRDKAKTALIKIVEDIRYEEPVLQHVIIRDIRYTFGKDEISVQQEINKIEPKNIGNTIQKLMNGVTKYLEEKGGQPKLVEDVYRGLTPDYRAKIGEMGIALSIEQLHFDLVVKQVLQALIEVLGKTRPRQEVLGTLNTLLQKVSREFTFLHSVTITPSLGNETFNITIATDFDTISERDIRKALQKLLEEVIHPLEDDAGKRFTEDFEHCLEDKYQLQLEKIGINLHILQLRRKFLS